MPLFDGISGVFSGIRNGAASLFSGVRSLFGGERPSVFDGDVVTPRSLQVFDVGDEVTGKRRGDGNLFEGGGPLPPGVVVGGGLAHVSTFSAKWNTVSRSYNWRWDEAYSRSREDALAMRRDCFLQSLLYERAYPTSQMSWHLEPENKQDTRQVQAADYLTACIQAIPDFNDYLFTLQTETLWAGRGGMQNVWNWKTIRGHKSFLPCEYIPTNGDKIQQTWDGIPEVMIYAGDADALKAQGAEIRMTDRWMMLVLSNPTWRDRWIIHKCFIRDADFFASQEHGKIHGTGLRDAAYWGWWLKTEGMSWKMEFLERVGAGGVTVYYYEAGNPTAKTQAVKVAKEQGRNTWIVWPRQPGDTGATKGIDRVEPNLSGADVLIKIEQYWDQHIERLFIGQTLSSGTEGSGLGGTGVAKVHGQTKQYILTHDARKLQGTLTRDLVGPLLKYNCPDADFPVSFVFDIDSADPKEKLEAVSKAWAMGVSFDEDEVRALTGCKKPEGDASVIRNPQIEAAQQQMQMQQQQAAAMQPGASGGVFQGQPNGDGGSLFDGSPTAPQSGIFGGQSSPNLSSKEGPPVRNAATETPPMLPSPSIKPIAAVAYRGENLPPAVAVLGPPADVTKFFAWLRTQSADLQQFAIDASTNPAGDAEDVKQFAAELREALDRVVPGEGLGKMIRGMGAKLLTVAEAEGVEGIVVTDQWEGQADGTV